jgi:very-short-patch-repair endonuclease
MTDERPLLRMRRDAIASGYSDDELHRLARAGEWLRLRRGAYLDGPRPASVAEQHRLLVHATMAGLRRPAVVSHQSAAILHGMVSWSTRLDRVHVTRRPPAVQDTGRVLRCHVARLRPDEVVEIDGLAVTCPVRTVLDLARALPLEAAVVTLDAALHAGTVEHDQLRSGLGALFGVPGSRRAARAVALADGRSESVGESRSRVVLHQQGVPPTDLQHEVRLDGRVVARTDFVWEDHRLVGEFDGRIKYGRLLRAGQQAGDAVFEEKRREDAVREAGWGVIRWCWDDLHRPGQLAARIRRAQARASRLSG